MVSFIGLFCSKTYNCKEPTTRSHRISISWGGNDIYISLPPQQRVRWRAQLLISRPLSCALLFLMGTVALYRVCSTGFEVDLGFISHPLSCSLFSSLSHTPNHTHNANVSEWDRLHNCSPLWLSLSLSVFHPPTHMGAHRRFHASRVFLEEILCGNSLPHTHPMTHIVIRCACGREFPTRTSNSCLPQKHLCGNSFPREHAITPRKFSPTSTCNNTQEILSRTHMQ